MSAQVAAVRSPWTVARSTAFALCLAASVAFATFLDLFAGGVRHLSFGSIAFVLGYSALPAAIGLLAFQTSWAGRGLLVAAAVVAVLVFTPWRTRKRFVDDLHSIRIGMTADDGDRVMGRWQRRVDEQWSPSSPYNRYRGRGDRMVCFGSTVVEYDADVCEVIYLDGRVVYVEFLPD
jgi:hypothetical protein